MTANEFGFGRLFKGAVMKRLIFSAIVIAISLMLATAMLAGCGDDKNGEGKKGVSTAEEPEIESALMLQDGEYPVLVVKGKNLGEPELMDEDESEIKLDPTSELPPANISLRGWTTGEALFNPYANGEWDSQEISGELRAPDWMHANFTVQVIVAYEGEDPMKSNKVEVKWSEE